MAPAQQLSNDDGWRLRDGESGRCGIFSVIKRRGRAAVDEEHLQKNKLKKVWSLSVLNTVVPRLWLWRPFRRRERGSREEERDKLNNNRVIPLIAKLKKEAVGLKQRSTHSTRSYFISTREAGRPPPGPSLFLLLHWEMLKVHTSSKEAAVLV